MAHKPDTSPRNPLKAEGESKRRTKELGDQAPVGPGRAAAPGEADERRRTESREHADQGATSRDAAIGPWAAERRDALAGARGESGGASNVHPGQHGGVRATDPSADPQQEQAGGSRGRSGVKRGPSPADEPSSERTGTAPDRGVGSSRRTGKTGEDRHRPREG
ncbi:MAG TPA: hypothetical protein VEB22_14010 [Phycisphaerales bacterium]|nr:hypothetical protein [Phycisphaerales bacterium]